MHFKTKKDMCIFNLYFKCFVLFDTGNVLILHKLTSVTVINELVKYDITKINRAHYFHYS